MKCRPYLPVIRLMAAMGLGFDCASKVSVTVRAPGKTIDPYQ